MIKLKIQKADIYPAKLVLYWSKKDLGLDTSLFVNWIDEYRENVKLHPDYKIEISFKDSDFLKNIQKAKEMLKTLIDQTSKEVVLC